MVLAVMLAVFGAMPARATILHFKPLAAQKADRLPREAKKEYELALAALDKINYDLGFEHLTKAVELDPANVWLRDSLVSLALYLGDTRGAADSIKYYDLATINLREIASSPRLNRREQQRAKDALEMITGLRQSVSERDEKRKQYGLEIAKQYARIVYKGEKDTEESKAKRSPSPSGEAGKKEGAEAGAAATTATLETTAAPEAATPAP
jgi:hypothetical protein